MDCDKPRPQEKPLRNSPEASASRNHMLRLAQHERLSFNVLNPPSVPPELVEGNGRRVGQQPLGLESDVSLGLIYQGWDFRVTRAGESPEHPCHWRPGRQ